MSCRAFHGRWCIPDGYRRKFSEEKKRNPEAQFLRQCYAGMKLIVGRDELDESQGIRHKIEAFEHFLKANPEFWGKSSSFKSPSKQPNPVSSLVASRTSWHASITFSQYLALLTVADAFMVTSLREGMALRAHKTNSHSGFDRVLL
ncbi:hypothetical protein BKA83DRAFT_3628439 [Pisolithus microcarpus]|nr:hypothetical protein BKA83DRAFT_3628439 [Pisolithus microcarpus]